MQRAIAGALMSLSFFAAAAAQLPPEILVERYLLRAGRLMVPIRRRRQHSFVCRRIFGDKYPRYPPGASGDPKGALEVMSKIRCHCKRSTV